MPGRSQIPPSLLSISLCLEFSATKFLVRHFPTKVFLKKNPLKLRIFFRDKPSKLKLVLGEVGCHSAPCCVFFAIVETEETHPPVD